MTDASNTALPHGVVNNIAQSRYELDTDGVLSIADYVIQGDVITFTHTLTPPELRGRGIAARLELVGPPHGDALFEAELQAAARADPRIRLHGACQAQGRRRWLRGRRCRLHRGQALRYRAR